MMQLVIKKITKIIFDLDGASGDDKLAEINSIALDQIRLEPKVLEMLKKF